MHLKNLREYTLSFQAEGLSFLLLDVCVRGYNGQDVLDMTKAGSFFQYFSQEANERYAKEGVALYADSSAFTNYLKQLKEKQAACDLLAKQLLKRSSLSSDGLQRLIQYMLEYSQLYFCMGMEYVDAPASLQDDPTIVANLKILEKYKNPAREYWNRCFLDDTSYLMQTVQLLEKRFAIPKSILIEYSLQELVELFQGKTVEEPTIAARRIAAVGEAKHGVISFVCGEEARKIVENITHSDTPANHEVRGNVANPAPTPVRGVVALIPVDYSDFSTLNAKMETMPVGAILIAQTTAPELMVACRKAVAIVTDMGGLISHAAIVSRELGIPCIVGTKHATKVFKDGDMVEVDTSTGIIRKI